MTNIIGGNGKTLKTWPEWPVQVRPDWLLLTPAAADGWPKMWRVQRSGVDGISSGQLLMLIGDLQMLKIGHWATTLVHKDQVCAIVTAPPEVNEFLTWDAFMAIQQAEARQRAMAMAGMSGSGLVLPGPARPQ